MIQVDHHMIAGEHPSSMIKNIDMHQADLAIRDGQIIKSRMGLDNARRDPAAALKLAQQKGLKIVWITSGSHHQWYMDVHDQWDIMNLNFVHVYNDNVRGTVRKTW